MTESEHHDLHLRPLSEAERAAVEAEHWSWLRYIAISACDGMALGALVAIMLIRLDVQDIGTMLAGSSHEFGYTALLIAGFAHTFGMVVSGTAIWLRATERRE